MRPLQVGPDRYEARRDTHVFVLCLALSLVALLLPASWRDPVASGLRQSILLPFLELQRQTERWQALVRELDQMIAQRDSALSAAQDVGRLVDENAELRKLLQLSQRVEGRFVSAELLQQAQTTGGMTILLSAGKAHGVQELTPVVSQGGLVGLVTAVDARTSVAMTWAHPDFRASATTAEGSLLGTIAPTRGPEFGVDFLELRGLPYQDTIATGTLVLTAGAGGVLPRGIPIGRVVGVSREGAGWERGYYVRPAVHPAAVSHVLILVPRGEDLTTTFRPAAPNPDP